MGLRSARLGLRGRLDLAIAVPDRAAPGAEAIVVEYKDSEKPAGPHFKLQLAAYALLLEEAWGLPVRRGFIYGIPLRRAEIDYDHAGVATEGAADRGGDADSDCRRADAGAAGQPPAVCELRVSAVLQRRGLIDRKTARQRKCFATRRAGQLRPDGATTCRSF